jgi:hypothetical protein
MNISSKDKAMVNLEKKIIVKNIRKEFKFKPSEMWYVQILMSKEIRKEKGETIETPY